MDAILIASEIVGEWKATNISGFILKLDYEKAYDKVDWLFLEEILAHKSFESRWRMWIKGCLSSMNFSILINGRP